MASDRWPRPTRDPRGSASARHAPSPEDDGYDDGGAAPGYAETGYHDARYSDPRNSDPRYGDPRYADPRYGDPRYADPRYGDPRYGDPRYADPRYGDAGNGQPAARPRSASQGGEYRQAVIRSTGYDPRVPAGQRHPDGWPAGQRNPDGRAAGNGQPADHRLPYDPRDPRLADPRFLASIGSADTRQRADPRLADPRLAPDHRVAPGPRPAASAPPPRAIEAPRLAIEAPRPEIEAPPPPPPPPAQAPASYRQPEPPRGPGQPARPPAQRRRGENTRAVHLPLTPQPPQQPLATPVYRTASFTFGSAAEHAAVLAGAAPGFSDSRIDNPTVEAFTCAVAAMEGVNLSYQPAAQAFASGLAAISTVFWAFTTAGAHVVASRTVYGGTYGYLRNVASRFGVQTEFVDMTDLDQVRAALRPGTAVVYAETLGTATVAVADLAGLARIAHEAGALLVVDSTLAPPVVCRPLEHGADLVLHSATKYFGGHADVTGGVVTGHPELITKVRAARIDTGGSLGPDDSYLLRRGLETLPLRVRRQCATAQLLAAGLARHPAVRAVRYPGLTAHPGHELARRQFDAGPEGTRFGAIVTISPCGGPEAGMMFADRLRLARLATSLGGTCTKVSHVGSTIHRHLDPGMLAAAGLDGASVRFSVGLEDGEDLLADAMTALDSLGGR